MSIKCFHSEAWGVCRGRPHGLSKCTGRVLCQQLNSRSEVPEGSSTPGGGIMFKVNVGPGPTEV